jgi:glutamate--cysteine ligase
VLEVRGADAVPSALTCALPAIWKGILYDASARAAAEDLVRNLGPEERDAALESVARRGLAGEIGGRPVLALARDLVEVASEGLRSIGHAGRVDEDERCYLEPIREQLAVGRSPGQVILDRWEGEWGRSVRKLIEYARY